MQSIIQNTTTDLQLAGYSPRTVETYSYHVKKFLDYFKKDPQLISEDEIKRYILYLKNKKKLSGSASAQAISGIKFMFQKTMDMDFKTPNNEAHTHPLYIDVIQTSHTWSGSHISDWILLQYYIMPTKSTLNNIYIFQ